MNLTEVKENLEKKNYKVKIFENKEEASNYLNDSIDHKSVGFGGSETLYELDLYNSLSKHNIVYSHHDLPPEEKQQERINESNADIYLSSVNGMSKQGEIINIDGIGNRLSSLAFGHEKVYLVVGKNKIRDDLDSAIFRARNIASPKNAQRLGVKTPCAIKADKCYDCKSPERICHGLLLLYQAMMTSDVEILLINEDLGF